MVTTHDPFTTSMKSAAVDMTDTSNIFSPLYYGPACTHRDSTFNKICFMPISQADKLSIIQSMIDRRDTTALSYDSQSNIAEDYDGYCTIFETAVACSNYDIVKHLLQAGTNPNIYGRLDLGPPLHVAIRNLDWRMVNVLGGSGAADMNIRNRLTSSRPNTGVTQERLSARTLVMRMKVPEELKDDEKREWESKLEKTAHLVSYFVGRM